MKVEMKATKKILIIMVMAIAMLLILPKNVFAIDYYFDCYGKGFSVTGVTENEQYALSWELWKARSIQDFDNSAAGTRWNVPGKTVKADFKIGTNDGYYLMRRR